jgi:undecaprenyl diphosphate synthase
LPRAAGHRAGADAVRRVVEAAAASGVGTLTLFAFSSDNWKRPKREVWALLRLLYRCLRAETEKCVAHGVRVGFIGRRDRLPPPLRAEVEAAEKATAGCQELHLRIAVDYSARDSILRAAELARGDEEVTRENFARLLGEACHEVMPAPDVDLLIRTGGERRLSDFLLWECAYAELFFVAKMWPDFDKSDLEIAVGNFYKRERRFGCVPEKAKEVGNVRGGAFPNSR